MKQFFFLAGLPRSGATILSQVMNQNPQMWVSPASPLLGLMANQLAARFLPENIDYPRNDRIHEVIAQTPHIFYGDKNVQFVVDKNLHWQTPDGLSIAGSYVSETPKILCCVRSIPEILASFDSIISKSSLNVDNFIDRCVREQVPPVGSFADRRAEWLMRHGNDISFCLDGMKLALDPEYRKHFHFIEYDDFVADPETTLAGIYKFLDIEPFSHDFDHVVDVSGISGESRVTGIHNLHKIRSTVNKTSASPGDVLSERIIQRFSNLEFWRDLK
jgi:sulfotransferase